MRIILIDFLSVHNDVNILTKFLCVLLIIVLRIHVSLLIAWRFFIIINIHMRTFTNKIKVKTVNNT